jgi:hypothetical protein
MNYTYTPAGNGQYNIVVPMPDGTDYSFTVTLQYITELDDTVRSAAAAQFASIIASTALPSLKTMLDSLPVYSGSGPVPVSAGEWFINGGLLTQA